MNQLLKNRFLNFQTFSRIQMSPENSYILRINLGMINKACTVLNCFIQYFCQQFLVESVGSFCLKLGFELRLDNTMWQRKPDLRILQGRKHEFLVQTTFFGGGLKWEGVGEGGSCPWCFK